MVPSVNTDRLERPQLMLQAWTGEDDGPPGPPSLESDGDRPLSW
jgi:hypothetical protein